VVPEHEVAGEEDPGDRGQPNSVPRERTVAAPFKDSNEDEKGQPEERPIERPGRGRDCGKQVEDTGERDAGRAEERRDTRPTSERGQDAEIVAQE
jgi:hypothetical protein